MRRLLDTILLAVCCSTCGCVAASKPSHVIVGFGYTDAKKLLPRDANPDDVYIEEVQKQPDETALIVRFTELKREKRYRIATVTSNDVTITNGVPAPFTPAFLASVWGEVPAISSPDEKHWLLYRWGPSFVVSRTAPSNVLFSAKLQMNPWKLFLLNNKAYIVGTWGTGKELTAKVAELSRGWTNAVETDIPWATHCYDVDTNSGHILLKEKRRFNPRCFDYNVVNGKRSRVSYAREYMFFLPRDFAQELQKHLPFMLFEELSD